MLDIREEIKLLVEIKGVRDGINIINFMLTTQQTILRHMGAGEHDSCGLLSNATVEWLVEANIKDFTKLDSRAKTTQGKVRIEKG